jgi:hypothetical protein
VTVAPTTTDSNGNYSFSNNESVAGTYYYRATYAGYSTNYYANATSNGVEVTVTAQTTSNTNLTAVAAPTTVPYSTPFTISGTLSNATSPYTGITGATIQLQSSTDNVTFTNVPGATNVTGATGGYTISKSEPTAGTYYYRTTYAGDAFYNSTTSNVVNVTVTTIGTTLNATVNGATSTSVLPSVPFTINGTLTENTTGAPIQNQLITLQNSTDNATWTTVNTTRTNSLGFYQFNQSQPVAGLYYYHTTYANNTVYSNAVSLVVTAQVGSSTTLNATVNGFTSISTAVNTSFTISGTLNVTGGTGIYNQPIQLRQNESGTWTTVNTTTTGTSGDYAFSVSESAPGTYQFQTTFAGAGNLAAATSNVVTVSMGTTTLTAAANVTSTEINTNFTINGTLLNDTPIGVANATITLQSSTNNVTWSNVGTNVTNATGGYAFNQSEPTLNTYYFQTTYAGNTTLGNATSNVVNVTVNTVGVTHLTAVAAPTTVPYNVNFTINGTLNDTSGTPITGATITLNRSSSGYAGVATTTTDSNGNYSFSYNESAPSAPGSPYQYKTVYAGYNNGVIAGTTSNVVNVTVTNVMTQLTAAANVSTSKTNTNFTISGTLSTTNGTTPGPIANAIITLQSSTNNVTWSNVGTNVTNATGGYAFNQSEPTLNTYYFQTTYAGSGPFDMTDFYANATSPVVTVQVGPPTNLTAAANVSTVPVNTPFTISGTLSTPSGVLSGQIIALQSNSTGNWTTVNTTTTDTNGNYSFSVSESVNGTYYYQTTYAGTSSILPATSNTVNVTVTTRSVVVTSTLSPAVTDNLYLFVRGSDNALWYRHWTGTTWTASTSLGGILTSSPAATSPSSGVIDVFVRGSDGVIWTRTTTNGGTSWSAWTSIGGQTPSGTGPAVCSQGSGLDVFVQGTDGALWHKSYTGSSWSGWQSLGGILTSSPAATSRSSGTIDVFVRGSDGVIWTRTTTNGGATWNAWHSIGGQVPLGTGPAADAQNANSLDVFVQGTDHALWYDHWDGTTWSGWKSLGGVLPSSPAATSPANGVIDVFVRGTDNALWERPYNNGWLPWTSIGGL